MNREFIPYEPSLALKELGFDEPCLSYYFSDGTFNDASEEDDILYPGDPRFHSDTNSSLSEYLEDELKYNAIAAPLYQQAFRFFREKYNLTWEHQFDDSNISLYVGEIAYPDNNLDFFKIIEVKYDGYNKAHEEAELECLKKLIEIVKQK